MAGANRRFHRSAEIGPLARRQCHVRAGRTLKLPPTRLVRPNWIEPLQCVSPPNSTNIVLSTASLVPPVAWQPLATNLAGQDGSWEFTDTNAPAYQSRFYSFVVP